MRCVRRSHLKTSQKRVFSPSGDSNEPSIRVVDLFVELVVYLMKMPTLLALKSGSLAIAAAASLFLATRSFAQAQVNPQVNYGSPDARLVPLIGQELYGNNNGLSTGRYVYSPQTSYLPSENRFAIERTGALPSELLLNRQAVGPLAPNGNASYVPQQSTIQQINHVPAPQLYNPAYRNSAPNSAAPGGPAAAHSAPMPQFAPGTLNYPVRPSNASPNSYLVPPRRVPGTMPSDRPAEAPSTMVQLPFNEGTIRYLARLEKERTEKAKAATQPSQEGAATTQPSLPQ